MSSRTERIVTRRNLSAADWTCLPKGVVALLKAVVEDVRDHERQIRLLASSQGRATGRKIGKENQDDYTDSSQELVFRTTGNGGGNLERRFVELHGKCMDTILAVGKMEVTVEKSTLEIERLAAKVDSKMADVESTMQKALADSLENGTEEIIQTTKEQVNRLAKKNEQDVKDLHERFMAIDQIKSQIEKVEADIRSLSEAKANRSEVEEAVHEAKQTNETNAGAMAELFEDLDLHMAEFAKQLEEKTDTSAIQAMEGKLHLMDEAIGEVQSLTSSMASSISVSEETLLETSEQVADALDDIKTLKETTRGTRASTPSTNTDAPADKLQEIETRLFEVCKQSNKLERIVMGTMEETLMSDEQTASVAQQSPNNDQETSNYSVQTTDHTSLHTSDHNSEQTSSAEDQTSDVNNRTLDCDQQAANTEQQAANSDESDESEDTVLCSDDNGHSATWNVAHKKFEQQPVLSRVEFLFKAVSKIGDQVELLTGGYMKNDEKLNKMDGEHKQEAKRLSTIMEKIEEMKDTFGDCLQVATDGIQDANGEDNGAKLVRQIVEQQQSGIRQMVEDAVGPVKEKVAEVEGRQKQYQVSLDEMQWAVEDVRKLEYNIASVKGDLKMLQGNFNQYATKQQAVNLAERAAAVKVNEVLEEWQETHTDQNQAITELKRDITFKITTLQKSMKELHQRHQFISDFDDIERIDEIKNDLDQRLIEMESRIDEINQIKNSSPNPTEGKIMELERLMKQLVQAVQNQDSARIAASESSLREEVSETIGKITDRLTEVEKQQAKMSSEEIVPTQMKKLLNKVCEKAKGKADATKVTSSIQKLHLVLKEAKEELKRRPTLTEVQELMNAKVDIKTFVSYAKVIEHLRSDARTRR